jgi:hypothetical protein
MAKSILRNWNLGNQVPRINTTEFQVQLRDYSVRVVKPCLMKDGWTLWFTDGMRPMQNEICDDSQIIAWREAAHGIKENT